MKSLFSDILRPKTTQLGGRIFKTTGDGALAEFASAVDAVQCAVDIQRELAASNLQIQLRIGISQRDVIVEDDDLYGNGVNVAARMEGLAEPDGFEFPKMSLSMSGAITIARPRPAIWRAMAWNCMPCQAEPCTRIKMGPRALG